MTSTRTIANLSVDELRSAVVARYGRVATHPGEGFNFPVGRAFAEAVGYPSEMLDSLPASASQSFAGVAYLPGWVVVESNATIVDLGCGAGLDSLIVASRLRGDGQLISVDYSADMAALARVNAQASGSSNVRVVEAAVEQLPIEEASVDVVIANGIFNLSPEKERVVNEIARILKPGGAMTAAEIVLTEDIPAEERATLDDWFR